MEVGAGCVVGATGSGVGMGEAIFMTGVGIGVGVGTMRGVTLAVGTARALGRAVGEVDCVALGLGIVVEMGTDGSSFNISSSVGSGEDLAAASCGAMARKRHIAAKNFVEVRVITRTAFAFLRSKSASCGKMKCVN
jgi:hypothetical protein